MTVWCGVAYHLIVVTNRQSTWIETVVKFERALVVYNQVFMLQQFFSSYLSIRTTDELHRLPRVIYAHNLILVTLESEPIFFQGKSSRIYNDVSGSDGLYLFERAGCSVALRHSVKRGKSFSHEKSLANKKTFQ